MKVYSFVRDGLGLREIEVELSLISGLPQMKFLGLPDSLIRESEIRIRTALKNQGFQVPCAKTILVQLRPAEFRKQSRGLDLAVAAAYLWETEQLAKPTQSKVHLYGELDFEGRVLAPSDVSDIATQNQISIFITGETSLAFESCQLQSLKELAQPKFQLPQMEILSLQNDLHESQLRGRSLSREVARVAEIIATGEHPTLFAGPHGTGKTTAAESIAMILPRQAHELKMSQQIARYFGENLTGIPIRRPHHKSSILAMIGGGRPIQPGEITRAHGGVLIMDEFLEFDSKIQEALREPMESGRIWMSRAGTSRELPAKFLLLATTNLCRCGRFVPMPHHKCRCTLTHRRSYLDRLSGPILDRFHMLSYSHAYSREFAVPLSKICNRVLIGRQFAREVRQQEEANGRMPLAPESGVRPAIIKSSIANSISQRRWKTTLQVARSIADLEQSEFVEQVHFEEALDLTVRVVDTLTLGLEKYL